MNWYNLLKLSMPLAQVLCPTCHAGVLVDIKQRIDTLKSDPYAVKETGECITICKSCNHFMEIKYTFDLGLGFFAQGSASHIDDKDVMQRVQNGTLLVSSTTD